MNNDLNEVRVFVKVAHLKSFTKAAKALNIEKSTASNKVKQLETRLNSRLLQRTTRSVLLTPAGETYLEYCQQALAALEQGTNYLSDLNQEPSGYMKVAVPHNLLEVITPTVITPFLNSYPKVNLEIVQVDNPLDLIDSGCDLALRFEFDAAPDSNLIYRKLFDTQWMSVAAPSLIERFGKPESLETLLAMPSVGVVGVHKTRFGRDAHALYWKGQKVTLTPRLVTNNSRATIEAIKAGIGFGVMPKGMVADAIKTGELCELSPALTIEDSSMYVVYPHRFGQPAKTKAFIEALFEWAGSRA